MNSGHGMRFLRLGGMMLVMLLLAVAPAVAAQSPMLSWGTYLGGSNTDSATGLTVDAQGNVYAVGTTNSSGWVSGGYDTTYNGHPAYSQWVSDGYLVKFSPAGALLWITYLGLPPKALATDQQGNVFVTVGSLINYGSFSEYVGNLLKISPTGTLVWTMPVGSATSLAADSAGNAYLLSGNVVKFSPDGERLWETNPGGVSGAALAIDGQDNIFVLGTSWEDGWLNGWSNNTPKGGTDAFLLKLSPAGQPLWSTCLGGSYDEDGVALAVTRSGGVCVAGITRSPDWATENCLAGRGNNNDSIQNHYDHFVADLTADGQLLWTRRLAGVKATVNGIAVDGADNVFLTGFTTTAGWPTGGFDLNYIPGIPQVSGSANNGFLLKLTAQGNYAWSTYLGGQTTAYGVAAGKTGEIYVAGTTSSAGWLTGGWDGSYNGSTDGFVARIDNNDAVVSGSLRVALVPLAAVLSGAQWRRVGTTAWLDSGATEVNIPAGTNAIEFKPLPGWAAPAQQWVSVNSGQTTATQCFYVPGGSLRVTLAPAEALAGGAQWRRVGTTAWHDSGATEDSLAPGTCTLEFRHVTDWIAPVNKTVVITAGQTQQTSGTYVMPQAALTWSSYLGGNSDDEGNAIILDRSGNIYVTGNTTSAGWVSGGYDTVLDDGMYKDEAFVVKLSPAGQHLWSTYLGGNDRDQGHALAIDADGNVGVAGYTQSIGWVSGGFNTTFTGYSYSSSRGFVVKLSPTGQHLWSTYLGNTSGSFDDAKGIAVDGAGNFYVTGAVGNAGWLTGGLNAQSHGGQDAYVVKLTPDGQQAWGTCLGGSGYDYGNGITLDSAGNICVTGYTESPGWVAGGYNTTFGGNGNGFVLKLTPAGQLAWSTYLGGAGRDSGYGIAVDGAGNICVTGSTGSPGWVAGGYNTKFNAGSLTNAGDGYVVKLSPAGQHLWSTYLGGSIYDSGSGIAIDSAGNIFVTGTTMSSGWTWGGFDDGFPGDGFLAKLSPAGQHLWSACLRGDANGLALDGNGNIFVTGTTDSAEWVLGDLARSSNMSDEVFVLKIRDASQVSQRGTLTVNVTPPEAVVAGAQWRRLGSTAWRAGGTSETNITSGTYPIEFLTIPGWTKPQNQMVKVQAGQTTVTTGAYARQTGALCVSLTPPEAVAAGAQWRRVGTTAWLDAGTTDTGVPSGSLWIEFKDVSGWTRPVPTVVSIIANKTTLYAANYLAPPGGLRVTIAPPAAAAAGLKWRRVGAALWRPSGDTEAGLQPGDYALEFTPNPDWLSPFDTRVTIRSGQTTETTAAYRLPQSELSWSTYVGGSGYDIGHAVAMDASGNICVAGTTSLSGWVSGGYDTTYGGGDTDAFVIKIAPDGRPLWSTYLGGNGYDQGNGIAVDGAGNIAVTGVTNSAGWLSGGYSPAAKGLLDGFLVKLSAQGQMLWGTYLGGAQDDAAAAVAVDGQNNFFVTGETRSDGWTSGTANNARAGGFDAFVAKVSNQGQHLWSACLGGAGDEHGYGIAVNGSGGVCVTGSTASTGWVTGGFDTTLDGGTDAFVARISATGQLLWSTCLGGSGTDEGRGIATDGANNIYVTGSTAKGDWSQGGGFLQPPASGGDAFVVKLASDGRQLWSTCLGGTVGYPYYSLPHNDGYAIAIDPSGNLLVTGRTYSSGWVSGGYDESFNGSYYSDAFVAKLSSAGQPLWSTYVGGLNDDTGYGIAVNGSGVIAVTGSTQSSDLAVGGYNTTNGNSTKAFLARLRDLGQVTRRGTFSVTITPPEAVTAGAQWRRVGSTFWRDGGTTITNVPAGTTAVEFKPVTGWTEPPRQAVTVDDTRTTALTVRYASQYGSLTVMITPSQAVTAGAKWRRVGTTTWLDSGATEANIPPGNWSVEFKPGTSWRAPANILVTVKADQTTQAMATWTRSAVDGAAWTLY